MKKTHLVVLYPHIGLLKNFVRQKEIKNSQIVIYSSVSNFIRMLQSQDVFDRLRACGACVRIALPLINVRCELSGNIVRFLRRITLATPIFFQEVYVFLASAIAPKLKLDALNLFYYDELTVDASLETSFLLQDVGEKSSTSKFVVNILSHGHNYADSVVKEKKQSLGAKISSLGLKSQINAVVAVRSETLLSGRTPHCQFAVDTPYVVIFQRSPDQYINEHFMFSVFTEILEWGYRNNVTILIRPHVWPNRQFLVWYFYWRFICRRPVDLTYSEPEVLIDGALGAICFYSSILHEISSRQKPGLQAVSDPALPARLIGPSSIVKAYSVPEVRNFLEGLQTV